jgi:2'-5' RNA ligase
MRLFAAVLPPDEAVDELGRTVDRMRALPGAEGLVWTQRAGWHFTLAFMGEVDDSLVPELERRLARAAARQEVFPFRVSGGGQFGHRALWAGAADGTGEVRRLAERAEAAARRAGIPMEEHRRYTPHLTLARSRVETDLRPYVEVLDVFRGMRWEVAELSLIRSRLPTSGVRGEQPRYEKVGGWALGGPA